VKKASVASEIKKMGKRKSEKPKTSRNEKKEKKFLRK